MITQKGPLIAILLIALAALAYAFTATGPEGADPNDAAQVAQGGEIYAGQCAECHGTVLEGEPGWRQPKLDGSLRAPPHDESGHSWHHDDQYLFDYTKLGGTVMGNGRFKSNMPGFSKKLSDAEIWAVLSFIKSRWPFEVQMRQEETNAKRGG